MWGAWRCFEGLCRVLGGVLRGLYGVLERLQGVAWCFGGCRVFTVWNVVWNSEVMCKVVRCGSVVK